MDEKLDAPSGYLEAIDACAVADLSSGAQIVVTGADARDWLQGLVSNDMRKLSESRAVRFCMCDATGHIEAVGRAVVVRGAVHLHMPSGTPDDVMTWLNEMIILEDVSVTDVSDSRFLFTVQGAFAADLVSTALRLPITRGTEDHCWRSAESDDLVVIAVDRAVFLGLDISGPVSRSGEVLDGLLSIGAVELSAEALESLRIEGGCPTWGHEITHEVLPPELGPSFEAGHVAYDKGCYVGQEVLQRIHARGHTNRTLVQLTLDTMNVPGVGALLESGENREVGRITSAVLSPGLGGVVALGFVRREFAAPTATLTVRDESQSIIAEVLRAPI